MCSVCEIRGSCWQFHLHAEANGPLVTNSFYMPAQAGSYVEVGREQRVVARGNVRRREEEDQDQTEDLRVETDELEVQQEDAGALLSPRKRRKSFRSKKEANRCDTVTVEESGAEGTLTEESGAPRRGDVAKK